MMTPLTNQQVLYQFPPGTIFQQCKKQFGMKVLDAYFSYGDKIYAPNKKQPSHTLIYHESIHGIRQIGMGVDIWWKYYLERRKFRFDEEAIAHIGEWHAWIRYVGINNAKKLYLRQLVDRLSGKLYGKMCDRNTAIYIITTANDENEYWMMYKDTLQLAKEHTGNGDDSQTTSTSEEERASKENYITKDYTD